MTFFQACDTTTWLSTGKMAPTCQNKLRHLFSGNFILWKQIPYGTIILSFLGIHKATEQELECVFFLFNHSWHLQKWNKQSGDCPDSLGFLSYLPSEYFGNKNSWNFYEILVRLNLGPRKLIVFSILKGIRTFRGSKKIGKLRYPQNLLKRYFF